MSDPVTIGLMVGGTLLSAYGTYQQGQAADAQGKAQQQAAEFQAKQMDVNAGQERASAQRRMIEELRKKDIAQSNATAAAAASGGGTLDPSVVDIMGDLESEGRYNADVAMYEGEERARDLESGASVQRYEGTQARAAGKMAKKSATIGAIGSTVSGLASAANSTAGQSLMSKYGGSETIQWSDGTSGTYRSTGRTF